MKLFKGRVHELKTWPEPYTAVLEGRKSFEIREDDRGFAVGDILFLREYDPVIGRTSEDGHTGRSLRVRVTYMVPAGAWGLPKNLCVMSIGKPCLIVDLDRVGSRDEQAGETDIVDEDEDARGMVLDFLMRDCDLAAGTILVEVYRCSVGIDFHRNDPFQLHEFGSDYNLEQIAQTLVDTCRSDIDRLDALEGAQQMYAIRLRDHIDRIQFRLKRLETAPEEG